MAQVHPHGSLQASTGVLTVRSGGCRDHAVVKGSTHCSSVVLGSVPSSLSYNSSSKEPDTPFWPPQALHTLGRTSIVVKHAYTQNKDK